MKDSTSNMNFTEEAVLVLKGCRRTLYLLAADVVGIGARARVEECSVPSSAIRSQSCNIDSSNKAVNIAVLEDEK